MATIIKEALIIAALAAAIHGAKECADLTGTWTCTNLQSGKTKEIDISQEECTGSTTYKGVNVPFAVRGNEGTITGGPWNGVTADVNPSVTEIKTDLFVCNKV